MNSKIIKLPKIKDTRGCLTFLEGLRHIPFEIKRAFLVYGVFPDATRGGHAHKNAHEFIIAAAGSFDILTNNGKKKKKFRLDTPSEGLFLPAKTWIKLSNFSVNSVCIVFTSQYYNEKDYVKNYEFFKGV